jgi:DnaK suppressor protein
MSFSETEIKRFKATLIDLRNTLLKANETGGEAEQVVELDQTRVGRLSRMDALQAQAMSLETGRRRRQGLVNIDAALNRIVEGDFGQCFECGAPINPKRLEADPTATLCISCAEALE